MEDATQPSYWRSAIDPIPAADPAPLPESVDVVVVGGGYTGLTTALGLARAGARVALLEAETLGWGASSRNGGIIHPGLKWGRATLVARYGPELGELVFRAGIDCFFETEALIRDEGIDAEYERSGLVVLAWSRRHLASRHRRLEEYEAAGLHGRVLEGSAIRDEVGTDHYPGGMLLEESGRLQPARYLAGLATAALAAGVEVHIRTRATAISDGASAGSRTVMTPRGGIRTRDVVIATNGYSGPLWPYLQRRVLPIASYVVATAPLSPDEVAAVAVNRRTYYDTKDFLYYWQVDARSRLVFGGRASFRRTSLTAAAELLRRAILELFPQLASTLRIDHAWSGQVGFTFDRLPHLGRHDGIHHALGYCGGGLALSTAFGLQMARIVGRGSDTAADPSPFERIDFPGAPVLPAAYRGRAWFLPMAGEWYRLHDRLERRH